MTLTHNAKGMLSHPRERLLLASWCIFRFVIFRKMAPLTGVLLRQVTECRREGAKLGYLHEENIGVRVKIK